MRWMNDYHESVERPLEGGWILAVCESCGKRTPISRFRVVSGFGQRNLWTASDCQEAAEAVGCDCEE